MRMSRLPFLNEAASGKHAKREVDVRLWVTDCPAVDAGPQRRSATTLLLFTLAVTEAPPLMAPRTTIFTLESCSRVSRASNKVSTFTALALAMASARVDCDHCGCTQ